MAVSPYITWSPGQILTAADLNNSFTQITGNGEDLAWPATKAKDFDGQSLILDGDGDTSITADTDDQIDINISGADDFQFTANTFTILSGSTLNVASGGTLNIASGGTLTITDNLDLQGASLILDDAGTTSITADTNNQIDIEINSADDFQFVANAFNVLSGSIIDMQAQKLVLDDDGDTSITASTDDQIDFEAGGADRVVMASAGMTVHGNSLTVSGDGILAPHKNLVVLQATVTTVDVDADEIILTDSNNYQFMATSVNLTANITASGANGLDTGTEATSTWYYIWVIYNPGTTTTASLLSASATSPTLPSGYTYKGFVGAVYNSSGGDFADFHQVDRNVSVVPSAVLSGGVATTATQLSLTAFVPTGTRIAVFSGYATNNAGGTGDVYFLVAPDSACARHVRITHGNDASGYNAGGYVEIILEGLYIYYLSSIATNAVTITTSGYKF